MRIGILICSKSTKKFILKVRNYSEHKMLSDISKDWTIRQRYMFYFRQVVSSNHRRIIEKSLSKDSFLPISKISSEELSSATAS